GHYRSILLAVRNDVMLPHGEGGDRYLDQRQSVPGNEFATPLIVQSTLLAAMDSRHRHAGGLVKERDRLGVLSRMELDHQPEVRPERVDGKSRPGRPLRAGIATQPVEAVLAQPCTVQDLVAEVEDVTLSLSRHGSTIA